jgi:hypothetical protein
MIRRTLWIALLVLVGLIAAIVAVRVTDARVMAQRIPALPTITLSPPFPLPTPPLVTERATPLATGNGALDATVGVAPDGRVISIISWNVKTGATKETTFFYLFDAPGRASGVPVSTGRIDLPTKRGVISATPFVADGLLQFALTTTADPESGDVNRQVLLFARTDVPLLRSIAPMQIAVPGVTR